MFKIFMLFCSVSFFSHAVFADEADEVNQARPEKSKKPPKRAQVKEEQMEQAEHSSKNDRKSAISFELLGRGLLYSVNYDYMVSDSVALGAGLSAWSASAGASRASFFVVPLYLNYYFSPSNHRPFLTGGLDLLVVSASIKEDDTNFNATGSGAVGVLGGGYEFRGDGGFLFRATPYLFVARKIFFYFGLNFGYAF